MHHYVVSVVLVKWLVFGKAFACVTRLCSLLGFIINSKVFVHRGMQPCVPPCIWLKELSIKSITLMVTSLDA